MICYNKAKKMVADGKTTWEELEYLGLAEPSKGAFEEEFEHRKSRARTDNPN